ncbi:MAG: DUF2189 domain-containing protein [Gammaproteobacteria bacterium]
MTATTLSAPTPRTLALTQPFDWLAAGWRDFRRAPFIGVVHGLALAAFGALLFAVARHHFWFLAGAFSGFLLIAPVLAVGLYAVSRAFERGEPVGLGVIWRTWLSWRGRERHDWRLVRFGLLLALAGTGWVLTSASLITLYAPAPIATPRDFLDHVVLAREGFLFEIWLALGGVLAAPVFASSVITLPLLLDRRIGVLDAVLTSWRAVLANPAPLALWAALIMGLTLCGLVPALLGLVVVVPWLGHASWHAYRDTVDASTFPPREADRPA